MYCLFFRTPGILAMIFLLLFLAGDVELNPGPPKYGRLTSKDLGAIQAMLWSARAKWYNIGLRLELLPEELDVVRRMHANNPDECFTDLLARWLRRAAPQPTWNAIVKALNSSTVDMSQLACEIESEKLGMESMSPESTAACVTYGNPIDTDTLSPTKGTYQNIRVFQGLTDKQREELEQRLTMETEDIKFNFFFLRNKFFKSLDNERVPIEQLTHDLQGITALKAAESSGTHIPNELEKMKRMIEDHSTFFDFRLVEYMIELDGLEEDKHRLTKYKESFEHYLRRRTFECCSEFGPNNVPNTTELRVKLESDYCKLIDLKLLQCRLSLILDVSVHTLQLCSFKEGCIELLFVIPNPVQEAIFPLSSEQEEALLAEDVIRLSCGGYHFRVKIPQAELEHSQKNVELETLRHENLMLKRQISQARLEDSKKSVEIEALKREKEMLEHQFFKSKVENFQKDRELENLRGDNFQKDRELENLRRDMTNPQSTSKKKKSKKSYPSKKSGQSLWQRLTGRKSSKNAHEIPYTFRRRAVEQYYYADDIYSDIQVSSKEYSQNKDQVEKDRISLIEDRISLIDDRISLIDEDLELPSEMCSDTVYV